MPFDPSSQEESREAHRGAGIAGIDIGFQTGSWGNRWSVSRDFTNLNYGSGEALYATSPFGWGDPNALAPYVPAGQFGYNKVSVYAMGRLREGHTVDEIAPWAAELRPPPEQESAGDVQGGEILAPGPGEEAAPEVDGG